MTRASVTVVVPTKNAARTLRACLESIVRQSVRCGLVVVDCGSVDDSQVIASGFADLVLSAIFMRWREATRQPRWRWERRHWRLIVRMRVAIGIWLLVVGSILLSYGYWWGVLIFVAAALHFYFAYRLRHTIRANT